MTHKQPQPILFSGQLYVVKAVPSKLHGEQCSVVRRDTQEVVKVFALPFDANAEAEKLEKNNNQMRML